MHVEDCCDPGNRSENKCDRVEKPAGVRDPGSCTEHDHEKNADAHPRKDAEVEASKGERQERARHASNTHPQSLRHLCAGVRMKINQPAAPGHQCLTMALNPAPSRPFFAASAAFVSAYGPTCTR